MPSDTARATRALALIRKMYALEERARDGKLDADQRRELRQHESQPILLEIRALLDELAPAALPKSELGKAIGYANNQWTALGRFVDDGLLAIDNNKAERGMRDVAIGRKNWLFTGSPEGGARAALLYSLINSCKLAKIDPFEYLRDVIERVSTHPASRVAELIPRGWMLARAAKAN